MADRIVYQATATDTYDAVLSAQAVARERGATLVSVTEQPMNVPPSAGQPLERTYTITLALPPEGTEDETDHPGGTAPA